VSQIDERNLQGVNPSMHPHYGLRFQRNDEGTPEGAIATYLYDKGELRTATRTMLLAGHAPAEFRGTLETDADHDPVAFDSDVERADNYEPLVPNLVSFDMVGDEIPWPDPRGVLPVLKAEYGDLELPGDVWSLIARAALADV
jgi:hypothetical protein